MLIVIISLGHLTLYEWCRKLSINNPENQVTLLLRNSRFHVTLSRGMCTRRFDKNHVMQSDQNHSAKMKGMHLILQKLLGQDETPRYWNHFFSHEKNLMRTKMSTEVMTDIYLETMRTFRQLLRTKFLAKSGGLKQWGRYHASAILSSGLGSLLLLTIRFVGERW